MRTSVRPRSVDDSFDLGGELLQEVNGGAVDELVNGVEAQAVDVVVAHPHQRVVAEEAAHLVAAGAFEVDGVAPRRAVSAGEVGTELAGVIADRTEVVVDHVEKHCEAALWAASTKRLSPSGPP